MSAPAHTPDQTARAAARMRLAVVRRVLRVMRRAGALSALISSFSLAQVAPSQFSRALARTRCGGQKRRSGLCGLRAFGAGGGGPGRGAALAA